MKHKIIIALFGIGLLSNVSCTDLEEEVIDESLEGSGQAEAISGAIDCSCKALLERIHDAEVHVAQCARPGSLPQQNGPW